MTGSARTVGTNLRAGSAARPTLPSGLVRRAVGVALNRRVGAYWHRARSFTGQRHWLLPSTLGAVWDDAPGGGAGGGRTGSRTPRDWFVDISCVLLASGWAIGVFVSVEFSLLNLVCGIASCGALWFRRQAPVAVATLLLVISVASSMSAVADLIALLTVAVHRHSPVALLLGLGHVAAQIGYSVAVPGQWDNFLLVVLVWAVVIVSGMFVRARRELLLSLREQLRQAERDAELREERAEQLERQRIAREMHDVLAHRISLLSMHAGALEYRTDADPRELAQAVSVIRGSAHEIMHDLREVIGVLRRERSGSPAPARPAPTLAHLDELVAESRAAGGRVTLDNRVGDLAAMPATTDRHAYRIAQEGLTNARKHAPGCLVEITVSGSDEEGLSIGINNRLPVSGLLAPRIPGSGLGLIGMRERAHLAGGQLEYRREGGRFLLSAWLPWEK